MKLALSFYGSRGDIQPGVCLGHELARRGHSVTMLVPPNYVSFAASMGLAARPIGLDSESYWESDRSRELLATRNPVRKLRLAQQQVAEGFARFDADLAETVTDLAAETGVDGLISGPLGQERIHALAEHLGVPMATMRFCAMSENGAIGAIPTSRALPAAVNRASWRTADAITWTFGKGPENRFRARLGLPAARQRLPHRLQRDEVVQLQAYDPVFFPGLEREWGSERPLVGFLDLPADERAAVGEDVATDSPLWAWLDAGPPPVYIAFGSAPLSDPDAVHAAIGETARALGVRALVGARGRTEGVAPGDDAVFVAGRMNHATVLPRCRAAVHHGGAGTTAATVRAGLPTMVASAGADQAHWGAAVTRLGIGTSTRLSRLDTTTLTDGLEVLLRPDTIRRAEAVGAQMIEPAAAVSTAANAVESAFTRTTV
ncbi:glycosyltransferase [Williamsia maris]|uniref:UDP:flavonoid glycosyltransferase YjiC, YdhE family n=1 Tax=Williamsia maris TaxID=72806 RepID=A0ABT1H989_9NOCA|nr:glycosyltransferase [Williamsia maris]MCP2174221.1 UDP:flavonoid glycosyltransferase YjiC, YdhE family [Williamsia maris]